MSITRFLFETLALLSLFATIYVWSVVGYALQG
jgi:hypothetical protein